MENDRISSGSPNLRVFLLFAVRFAPSVLVSFLAFIGVSLAVPAIMRDYCSYDCLAPPMRDWGLAVAIPVGLLIGWIAFRGTAPRWPGPAPTEGPRATDDGSDDTWAPEWLRRVWARSDLTEDEAMEIANREVHAYRRERALRRDPEQPPPIEESEPPP